MSPKLLIALVVLGFCTVFILPGCFEVIPPGHRGVSVTLGKVHPEMRPEGVVVKKPWIETIHEISVQQQTVEEATECVSSDMQSIQVAYSVLYSIPEGKVPTLYQNFKGDVFTTLVKPRVEEALKQQTALLRAEDIIKNREKLKVDSLTRVRTELNGLVTIDDLPLRNIELSKQLTEAIEAKQVKEQTSLSKEYELKGAQKEAEITIVKAKAEAEAIRIAGEALKDNPQAISLELSRRWDGKSPATVVIGSDAKSTDVILPLPINK